MPTAQRPTATTGGRAYDWKAWKAASFSQDPLLDAFPAPDSSTTEVQEFIAKLLRRRLADGYCPPRGDDDEQTDREYDIFLDGRDLARMRRDEIKEQMPPAMPSRLATLVANDLVGLREIVRGPRASSLVLSSLHVYTGAT